MTDRLKAFMAGVLDAINAPLLAELEAGYREIAEHEARMRRFYPDVYAEADRQLRKRYVHLDAEQAPARQHTPRKLKRHNRENPA